MSSSGHAANPDEIIASCQALQAHIQNLQEDAEKTLRDWEAGLREQELAEKRRVAPGWLDREEKILEPERARGSAGGAVAMDQSSQEVNIMDRQDGMPQDELMADDVQTAQGDELDRAFGGMALQKG